MDTTLPFGLRSAPLLFLAAAEALEWAVRESGFDHVFHYIDDFVLVGPPGSEECERGLRCLQQVCSNTGVILASDKMEGPMTRLTVLTAGDRVRHPGDDDVPAGRETAEAPGPPRHLARERLR